MPERRRFPPPWSIEELNDACFVVRDHDGQQLAYVHFEDEPGRRSAAKLLTKDEARRIAANIAKQSPRCFSAPRCINGPPPLSARTAPSAPSVGHAVSTLHRPTGRAVIPSPSVTVAGVGWWGTKGVVQRRAVRILTLGRYECAKGDCANAASG